MAIGNLTYSFSDFSYKVDANRISDADLEKLGSLTQQGDAGESQLVQILKKYQGSYTVSRTPVDHPRAPHPLAESFGKQSFPEDAEALFLLLMMMSRELNRELRKLFLGNAVALNKEIMSQAMEEKKKAVAAAFAEYAQDILRAVGQGLSAGFSGLGALKGGKQLAKAEHAAFKARKMAGDLKTAEHNFDKIQKGLQQTVAKRTKEVDEVKSELDKVSNTAKGIRDEVAQLRAKIRDKRALKEEQDLDRLKELDQQIPAKKAEKEALEKEIKEIEDNDRDTTGMDASSPERQAAALRYLKDKPELEKRLETAKKELQDLQSKRTTIIASDAKTLKAQSELATAKDELKNSTDALEASKQKRAGVQKKLNEATSGPEKAKLRADLKAVDDEISVNEGLKTRAERRVKQCENEVEQTKSPLKAQSELDDAKSQLQGVEAKIAACQTHKADVEKNLKNVDDELKQVDAAIEREQQNPFAWAANGKELTDRKDALLRRKGDLEGDLKKTDDDIATHEAEKSYWEGEVQQRQQSRQVRRQGRLQGKQPVHHPLARRGGIIPRLDTEVAP